MERDERWRDHRDGNPWLDHVRRDQQSRSPPETKFPNHSREFREYCSRQVRHLIEKTSSTSVRSTLRGRLLCSVSMMLIAFVTFWMCFIFVIPAGLLLILIYSITSLVSCGRRMSTFVRNMRDGYIESRAVPETDSANQKTISTSAATPDSNY